MQGLVPSATPIIVSPVERRPLIKRDQCGLLKVALVNMHNILLSLSSNAHTTNELRAVVRGGDCNDSLPDFAKTATSVKLKRNNKCS